MSACHLQQLYVAEAVLFVLTRSLSTAGMSHLHVLSFYWLSGVRTSRREIGRRPIIQGTVQKQFLLSCGRKAPQTPPDSEARGPQAPPLAFPWPLRHWWVGGVVRSAHRADAILLPWGN